MDVDAPADAAAEPRENGAEMRTAGSKVHSADTTACVPSGRRVWSCGRGGGRASAGSTARGRGGRGGRGLTGFVEADAAVALGQSMLDAATISPPACEEEHSLPIAEAASPAQVQTAACVRNLRADAPAFVTADACGVRQQLAAQFAASAARVFWGGGDAAVPAGAPISPVATPQQGGPQQVDPLSRLGSWPGSPQQAVEPLSRLGSWPTGTSPRACAASNGPALAAAAGARAPLLPLSASGLPRPAVPLPGVALPARFDVLAFSMMQPYAGLLLRGHKTLETRNSPMLAPVNGATVAIHLGKNVWPAEKGGMDGWRQAATAELAASIGDSAFAPPPRCGLDRGSVVGLVVFGETRPTKEWAAREGWAAVERRALVPRDMLAPYATEVRAATWLRTGVPLKGQPGVWTVDDPRVAHRIAVLAGAPP